MPQINTPNAATYFVSFRTEFHSTQSIVEQMFREVASLEGRTGQGWFLEIGFGKNGGRQKVEAASVDDPANSWIKEDNVRENGGNDEQCPEQWRIPD